MDRENVGGFTLKNLSQINVLLGKNGCGKSHLLKQVESAVRRKRDEFGEVRFISPERAGVLKYEPNVDYLGEKVCRELLKI